MSRYVLHLGCRAPSGDCGLPPSLRTAGWEEIRLDVEARVRPPILADLHALRARTEATLHAVYAPACLLQLWPHDVPRAFDLLRRHLVVDGLIVVNVPDLAFLAQRILRDGVEAPVASASGRTRAALDLLFGDRRAIARGDAEAAHRTGFTAASLGQALARAHFRDIRIRRSNLTLWATARRRRANSSEDERVMIRQAGVQAFMRDRDALDGPPALPVRPPPPRA